MLPWIAASSLITLIAAWPYLFGVVRGREKPRVASWLVWAVLGGIGSAAAFQDGQIPAAVFTLVSAGEYAAVVVLGWKFGDRKFAKLDIGCLVAAAFGLAALLILRSPTEAVIIVILIDAVGTIPTLVHCWQRPYEESWIAFGLFVVAEFITLAISNFHIFTAFAYPAFYLLEDVTLMSLILLSPHRTPEVPKSAPSNLSPPALGQPAWAIAEDGRRMVSVPVSNPGSGIARGEYIGEIDPGVGKGVPIVYANGRLDVTISDKLPEGNYTIQMRAVDAAGNWSQLVPVTWVMSQAATPA